jgi:hypothetical protein
LPDRIARRSTAIPEKFPFHVPVFVGQSAISGEFYQKLLGKKPEFSWLLLPKDYIENGFQVLYTHDTQRQKNGSAAPMRLSGSHRFGGRPSG